ARGERGAGAHAVAPASFASPRHAHRAVATDAIATRRAAPATGRRARLRWPASMTRLLVAIGVALSIGAGSAAAQRCASSATSLPVCAGEPDEAALAEARARFEEGLA